MVANIHQGFNSQVNQLRSDYQRLRKSTNLARPVIDVKCVAGEKPSVIYWYENDTEQGQCVRLYDVPGTLSGEILRLRRNLPSRSDHFEIDGDEVRTLDYLEPPEPLEDDFEDVSDLVARLPLIEVDEQQHFLKKGKYRSEIHNLIACQGGSCPGRPRSRHLIQLLGRSGKNELVFENLLSRPFVLPRFSGLATYKRWLLHIVDALETLHSLGIVHRDLRVENLLFSRDGGRLVVCDLEGRWGRRAAPEIAPEGLNAGWTAKSDVYDVGHCIECMVYANAPITQQVEWPVPAPLDAIVKACMREAPEDRPTLEELRTMVEAIETDAD
ncbi:MAG: hypothetical protein M1832_005891 [Thelocarpon impressellum]|nr:MAG: hypothetical protein M1832_005891 [Thelocarpon impressellum]